MAPLALHGGPAFLDHLWPTVERALDWVLSLRRPNGLLLWAVEADGTRAWDYALLTGTSSIQHALRCGVALAEHGRRAAARLGAADVMAADRRAATQAFEPKDRWAMDWYYPMLAGALTGEAAKDRLGEPVGQFAMEGRASVASTTSRGSRVRRPRCALAYAVHRRPSDRHGDCSAWTRAHRREDGSYWTGLVYLRTPSRDPLPVRGAHLVHRRCGDPRRRRDQRRLPAAALFLG